MKRGPGEIGYCLPAHPREFVGETSLDRGSFAARPAAEHGLRSWRSCTQSMRTRIDFSLLVVYYLNAYTSIEEPLPCRE
jgi:hypothetical protein